MRDDRKQAADAFYLMRWLRGVMGMNSPGPRRGGYNTGPGSVEAMNRYQRRVNVKARRRAANKAARKARRAVRVGR